MDFGLKIVVPVMLLLLVTKFEAKPYQEWKQVYDSNRFLRTTCSMQLSTCKTDKECGQCNEKLQCISKICHVDPQTGGSLYKRRRWNFFA